MKTSNPNIDIFKTIEQAKKAYDKITTPAHLLQCVAKGLGFGEYYVEILTPDEETAIECWPTHYKLIEQK